MHDFVVEVSWNWTVKVQACGPTATPDGVCPSAGKCLPPVPTDGAISLAKEGNAVCPAGYEDPRVRYLDVSDERSCAPCLCQPDQAVQTLRFYGVTTCGTATQSFAVPSGCGNNPALEIGNFMMLTSTVIGTPPACSAPPSPIEGSVEPQGMVTICCIP